MYKIKVQSSDTAEIRELISQANKIQGRYAWCNPSLEKYQLSIDFSKFKEQIRRLRA